MENEKLKELHKKIAECIYNIETGTFDHWKVVYKPNSLREGQITEGSKLVASSIKQVHALLDEFYGVEK